MALRRILADSTVVIDAIYGIGGLDVPMLVAWGEHRRFGGLPARSVGLAAIAGVEDPGAFLAPLQEQMEIDARPSDAIALAVRFDAPIFVADGILDMALEE